MDRHRHHLSLNALAIIPFNNRVILVRDPPQSHTTQHQNLQILPLVYLRPSTIQPLTLHPITLPLFLPTSTSTAV